MDFIAHYKKSVLDQQFSVDSNQLRVVESLQDLLQDFLQHEHSLESNSPAWLSIQNIQHLLPSRWFGKKHFHSNKCAPKGRYIWGGVGRGKSWIMELFFHLVPSRRKVRINFTEFMQQIHISLDHAKGKKNPLQIIAYRFAQRWQLICIDEFMVVDIADAMLLHGLLVALQDFNVTLIMTSNVAPDQLYLNGLQRDRFLPAIELIKNSMIELELQGKEDYRHKVGNSYAGYYYPSSDGVEQKMRKLFLQNVSPILELQHNLLINKRYIKAFRVSGNVVWFDFEVICGRPRSGRDYIELANRYRSLFISNVPLLDENKDDMAYRFIQLIDELYDRRIKVAISAALPPQELYQGRQHQFEFVRTISRLEEMRQAYR